MRTVLVGVEIERKFLPAADSWRTEVTQSMEIRQGFISLDPDRIVRVRLIDGVTGRLTVKGRRVNNRRAEFEYAIPAADAEEMLRTLTVSQLVEKRRHVLGERRPGEWVVDEFSGANQGLVMIEVEFEEGDLLAFPPWLGEEVSQSKPYSHSYLVRHPFTTW